MMFYITSTTAVLADFVHEYVIGKYIASRISERLENGAK
jgi:hypothetical protein